MKERSNEASYKVCLYCLIRILACLLLLFFSSCKSVQYVPVVEYHTDTTYITKQQRDSIWLHDSVYVHEYAKGDTIYMELVKWHTRYVEKVLTDTLYKHKTDSVPKPYPVPAKLTTWERTKMDFGGIAIVIALISFIFVGFKTSSWIRRNLPKV